MKPLKTAVLSGLIFWCAAAAASAGELKITNTTFGWNPFTNSVSTSGSTPESQFPAAAVNQELEIRFNERLAQSSVSESTILITSIPSSELAPLGLFSSIPGGIVAPVTRKVRKNKILIRPAYFFQGSSVNFGFAPNAYYRLELRGGGRGIKGRDGSRMGGSIYINFRTTDLVADMMPGAPQPQVKLIDAIDGKVNLTQTSVAYPLSSYNQANPTPAPGVQIKFNELVLPSSLLNPATGESPTLRILLDVDDNPGTFTDRIDLPGAFVITHTTKKTLVEWTSAAKSVLGDSFYLVHIEPYVEDLVGNSIYSITQDAGARQLFGYRTKDASGDPLDPIVEEFNDKFNLDTIISSADWNEPSALGFLKNGITGGTGEDGAYRPTDDETLTTGVFDADLGKDVQRVWNFTSVTIPLGVTVTAEGEFPLRIRSTGNVNIYGTLDVSGAGGDQFTEVRVRPGAGGEGAVAGASGALGGSVTDGVDLDTGLFQDGLYGYALATQPNQGLFGLSTVPVTDFVLPRAGGHLLSASHAGLWLQPNVGTGSAAAGSSPGNEIRHNHPTFMIESVSLAGSGSLTVISNPADPLYFGSLIQPSLDTYEFPPPPITKPGDPFMIGDMAGREGDEAGFAGSAGKGSLPMTVAQEFLTLVRSGGGGGGAARTAGEAGEDSPTAYGGSSTGTAGGAGGSAGLSGAVVAMTDTVLTVAGTPFAGLDLNGDADTPPFIVFPNDAQGYLFEIASNTGNTITIVPYLLTHVAPVDGTGDGVVDLADVSLGASYRVEPNVDVGGSGGGSSGVHLAYTIKTPGPPNQTPPTWTPGAGGGAGGGSVRIEADGKIVVAGTGMILARGGDGGRTTGALSTSASGGGGGAGGTVELTSGDPTASAVQVLGLVDCNGGAGGLGEVEGGSGGNGRAIFRSFNGNLSPGAFPDTAVTPPILATDLGFMVPGQLPTLGQSKFYNSDSFPTVYSDFIVVYNADVNGVPTTGLTFTRSNLVGGTEAPFDLFFNDAEIGSNGLVDYSTVDENFVTDPATLSGAFLRFRVGLYPEKTVVGDVFRNVKVDSITVTIGP
ncbi:MAG: hypothetical protein V2A76_03390 [Planctomycetota bacterium]